MLVLYILNHIYSLIHSYIIICNILSFSGHFYGYNSNQTTTVFTSVWPSDSFGSSIYFIWPTYCSSRYLTSPVYIVLFHQLLHSFPFNRFSFTSFLSFQPFYPSGRCLSFSFSQISSRRLLLAPTPPRHAPKAHRSHHSTFSSSISSQSCILPFP